MRYVFGPIPSRRLGQSLGVDTIPLKTCNWNCVYCQLGRTVPVTHERCEYAPRQVILDQATEALRTHGRGEVDWLTFVGSGEPTLHSGIGWLIRGIKAITDIPVAVITNGSLLYLPEVRSDLTAADAVMPTLVAGSADLFRRICRPHPEATFERLRDGLVQFRKQYTGRLWLEVMLVRGMNDDEEALVALAAVVQRIQPDELHITLPTRPPAESWVEPPDDLALMRATAILGSVAKVVHPAEGSFDLSGYDNVVDAVIGIITRHPMAEDQLKRCLGAWSPARVDEALAELAGDGRACSVERLGVRFWIAREARFPSVEASDAAKPGRHATSGQHTQSGKQRPA